MKLKHVVLASSLAILITAAPCFAAVDYAKAYDKVLRDFYQLIIDGSDEHVDIEGGTSVLEATNGKKKDAALNSVGYIIKDLTGDGIPELLIGAVTERKGMAGRGSRIYALYTCVNGTPRYTFDGGARNSYMYMGGGSFFNQGSNGAMYTIFGTYTLSKDGTSLRCNDYYFTFEKDKSFKEIGYYHNTSGKWNKAASKELKISQAQFEQIETNLSSQVKTIGLTPFSQYAKKSVALSGPNVRVQFAKDALSGVSEYDVFVAGKSEHQVKVAFSASATVRDFKVLALSAPDFKDGKMTFKVKELYTQGSLTPKRPLVVTMVFYGDIPNNGISYVDESGATKRFSVSISGNDGSLILAAF